MLLLPCVLVASALGLSVAAPTVSSRKRATGLQWFGSNESGAEFGTDIYPGVLDKDYTWPVESSIDALAAGGMNIFRIAMSMERIAPGTMDATLDATYLAALTKIVEYTTSKGLFAVIDPHNFGRYNKVIITDTTAFKTFWTNLATAFAANDKVIFDCNNEPHDMGDDYSVVTGLMQACIDGVRGAGAKQHIFVEGTSYSGAWTWREKNDGLKSLTDPEDKIVYEMHQYLDSDGSGTHEECVSATIGKERIEDATKWLKENGKLGVLGEFAGGANDDCKSAVKGMLEYMVENADVWQGAIWWAAGPWWKDYMYNMEPEEGIAYKEMLPLMQPIVGGGASTLPAAGGNGTASDTGAGAGTGTGAGTDTSASPSTTTAAAAATTTAAASTGPATDGDATSGDTTNGTTPSETTEEEC